MIESHNDDKTEDNMEYRIVHDDDPTSPREFDNLSIMVLFHKRYNLPNEFAIDFADYEGWADMRAGIEAEGGINILPVWGYDHGSLAIAAGDNNPFTCPWDSGQLGFVFTTEERIEWLGADRDRIEEFLKLEVEEYSRYSMGEVYGYEVFDDRGEVIDSCWGYYGYADAEAEAKAACQRELV